MPSGDGHVSVETQGEDDICKANGVTVAQVEGAVAIDPNRIDSIIIPIPRDRLVAS